MPCGCGAERDELGANEHLDLAGLAVAGKDADRRLDGARARPAAHEVALAEERCRPAIGRGEVELLRGAHLDDLPVAHQRDAVGEGEGFLAVVGDEERRDVERAQDQRDLVSQLGTQLRVDVRPRLVEQHDARSGRERPRERDALLLAAGELVGVPPAQPAEVDERKESRNAAETRSRRGRPKPTFSATVRCGKSA